MTGTTPKIIIYRSSTITICVKIDLACCAQNFLSDAEEDSDFLICVCLNEFSFCYKERSDIFLQEMFGMQNNESGNLDFHDYDRNLKRLLERINGKVPQYEGRRGNMNKAKDLSKLTPKNRELLLRVYNDCILKGNSKARTLCRVQRLAWSFILFENKDVDTATKEDFHEVFSKIMTDSNNGDTTKRLRVEELKRFDKEYYGNGEDYTPRTKFMKFARSSKSRYLPEDLLSKKDAEKIINSAYWIRDKAMLNTLWSTGARIGEIGNLKVKSFEYLGQNNAAHLMLNGKTGMRKVLIVEPVLDILAWIDSHPNRNKPDFKESYLFTTIDGKPLNHALAQTIIRKAMNRSGIKKRNNPHLWRHSRATYLCGKGLGEMQMRHYFGWAKGSDMPSIYIHLSQKGLDEAMRKTLGIDEEEVKEKVCKICAHSNIPNAVNCLRCGKPLSLEGYIQLDQERKIMDKEREISQKVLIEAMRLVQNGLNPEEAQNQAIKSIAQQQVGQKPVMKVSASN
ncbi:Tyrosine recombinase XerA [uncultured archaeon]|nr:Tyrosine recombinase XerA [uncultured archaeon]